MIGPRVLLAVALACGVLAFYGLPSASARDGAPEAKLPTRLWANSRIAWIYEKPHRSPNGLGYLRAGTSVALKTGTPVAGTGCAGRWYEVEPAGYLCADQRTAFEPTRYVKSMQLAKPRSGPLPFDYALSNHAPMYQRVPTREEWEHHERYLGPPGTFGPLSWGNRGHEKLAEVRAIPARDELPWFFAAGGSVSHAAESRVLRRMIPLGSTLAYTASFEHQGRTWLFSADGTLVPADRVRPFRVSRFAGVSLEGKRALPLAWVKSEPKPRFVADEAEGFETTKELWPIRRAIELDGTAPVEWQGQRYWKSNQRDTQGRPWFVRESDAVVVKPRDKLPWGIGADEKWLSVSITQGVLIAYRGLDPVFTTLVSPGAGGVPVEGRDPVKWSTTPLGRYRITFKHLADDMSPDQGEDRRFWLADVPYTQYFNQPFAIHVAYWHENFGDPMSAGCINVSPKDGKWLFDFTSPALPEGWQGIAPSRFSGQGTVIIITR